MTERADPFDSPEWQEYAKDVRDNLVPKLSNSAYVCSLVPEGEPDVKFSVELGMSIMLDKPIIAVVRPGTRVPPKLVLVADRILEAELDSEAGAADLMGRLNKTMAELDVERGDDA